MQEVDRPGLVVATLSSFSLRFLRTMSASPTATPKFYTFTTRSLVGNEEISFDRFRNKPVIVVNGASKCGYTEESYKGLSLLLDKYQERCGLQVVVFPCNQFMNQENEDAETISCKIATYDKRFVVSEKINVNGSHAHPLWVWLKEQCPGFLVNTIKWNFTKFLVDPEGKPIARFSPNDNPSKMESLIEKMCSF